LLVDQVEARVRSLAAREEEPMAWVGAYAAAEKRRQDDEEEAMAAYSDEELAQDWEFKIVRSSTSQFGKRDEFRALVEEEAVAGWQLLEKLDDSRVRFKRPASARQKDELLPKGMDPYRTTYGWSEGKLAFVIIGTIVSALLVFFGVIALLAS
jgi:hypothetical protein